MEELFAACVVVVAPVAEAEAERGGEIDFWDPVVEVDNSKGIKNENREPSPGFESTRSWPPSCSTILATTAKPRPEISFKQISYVKYFLYYAFW